MVRIDDRDRWAFGLGLGALAAIAAGVLAGNRTAAEMDPFYANLTAASGASSRAAEVVDASFVGPADTLPDTADLAYRRGRPDDGQYEGPDLR